MPTECPKVYLADLIIIIESATACRSDPYNSRGRICQGGDLPVRGSAREGICQWGGLPGRGSASEGVCQWGGLWVSGISLLWSESSKFVIIFLYNETVLMWVSLHFTCIWDLNPCLWVITVVSEEHLASRVWRAPCRLCLKSTLPHDMLNFKGGVLYLKLALWWRFSGIATLIGIDFAQSVLAHVRTSPLVLGTEWQEV